MKNEEKKKTTMKNIVIGRYRIGQNKEKERKRDEREKGRKRDEREKAR